MELLYRLAGVVARVSERMSHTRVNMIPINWIVGGVCVAGFVACANQARDALVNGRTPRTVTVSQVLRDRESARNYVSVAGDLSLSSGLEETSEGSSEVERILVPLLDESGKRGILVEMKSTRPALSGGRKTLIGTKASIVGMLVPLDSDARTKMLSEGGQIDGIPLDTDYKLVEGRAPGQAGPWTAAAVLLGGLSALQLITFLTRYAVFRPTGTGSPSLVAPADLSGGVDLRVTGRFVLDEKNARRFLNVPAGMSTLESGEIALYSNIDASSKFMGVTTAKRAGLWAIVLRPETLKNAQRGRLYDGMAVRPALRVRYSDTRSGKQEAAILSLATQGELEAIASEVNRRAGYAAVPV